MEILNAKVLTTYIGVEDHGIFTAVIQLEIERGNQGFGTYDLRTNDAAYKFIEGCLKITGAESWESLKGRPLRALRENGLIVAIGHFLEEKWFRPSEMF